MAAGTVVREFSLVLPPRRINKSQQAAMLRINAQAGSILYAPSINIPFTEIEGMYFNLFRQRTASELSGFFDSTFWNRSVLQACHSSPAIRHAVVALGALYKTLDKANESPPSSPDANGTSVDHARRHWEMACQKYSHAINSLPNQGVDDATSNRTRLMASILLACFDSFVGDHKQAIRQIQAGLKLLEGLRAEKKRAFFASPDEEPVEEELIQMFRRLAIQAKSYDMAFHFPDPYVIRLHKGHGQDPSSPSSNPSSPIPPNKNPIPERFSSVMDARVAWDNLCERIFRFRDAMFEYAENNAPNNIMGVLPAELRHVGASFKHEIEAWSRAFEPILESRTAPGVSSQEKAAIAVLKMFQIMGQILFLMTFSDSEMHFDNFIPAFKAIVDLAREVVGDEERRAAAQRCPNPALCHHRHRDLLDPLNGVDNVYTAHHIKPSFSADMGIVPPLYVVATKCRDPQIRRQAIQLLRSSARREAMWDSELVARIGMWVLKVEEEGLDLGSPSSAGYPSPGSASTSTAMTPPDSSPPQTMTMTAPQLSISTTSSVASSRDTSPMPGLGITEFGAGSPPLGPGGNAAWLEKTPSSRGFSPASTSSTFNTLPPTPTSFVQQQQQHPFQKLQFITTPSQQTSAQPQPQPLSVVVPEDKRVMVRAVDFDLRERFAKIELGSRNLSQGALDVKRRATQIRW